MLGSFNLDKTYHFLLVVLAFLLPLTVFGGNLVIVIICILWLISGEYKAKFKIIIKNKLMISSIFFFGIHVVGLLWTEDLSWGLHIVHKMWYFIGLLPILYTIVKKEYIGVYISAFLLAISITEVLSYLVWFQIIDSFKNATWWNPTPFMSHISYNPILAFAIYLVGHELLFNSKMHLFKKCVYSIMMMTMSINMFITGGRAGQVMFFAMLTILIFQKLGSHKLKAIGVIFIVIPSIFITAYQTSDIFHKRSSEAFHHILNYEDNKNTSSGQRITFAINSWEIIAEHPIIGVGTGDFPTEYNKINQINTPELPNTSNPHNMYTLILVQLGFIGLISFLCVFYYQIKLSFMSKNKLIRDVGLTLPLLFLIIMWSDSYLLGHYTTLMYVFFSSFLYKDFENT